MTSLSTKTKVQKLYQLMESEDEKGSGDSFTTKSEYDRRSSNTIKIIEKNDSNDSFENLSWENQFVCYFFCRKFTCL